MKTQDDIVKVFYDLETTGVDVRKNGIHQIAGLIEVNGVVEEEFNYNVQPHPKAIIEDEALAVSGVTREDLESYRGMKDTYWSILRMFQVYCDRFNKKDKMYLIGYNNRQFDDNFFRQWFILNKDPYFGSWFWSDSIDVIVLASQFLIDKRSQMPNFQLRTVAKWLGITVDESRLHDAAYDIALTRQMYQIVTGQEESLL